MDVAVETKVGRKRIIVIPKAVADAIKMNEGQKVRVVAMEDKVVIEPIRDAVWLALHGRKIGKLTPEEVEEESLAEQEKLLNKQ